MHGQHVCFGSVCERDLPVADWLLLPQKRTYAPKELGSGSTPLERSMTMQTSYDFGAITQNRQPWNKGKLTGQKPPIQPKHVVVRLDG